MTIPARLYKYRGNLERDVPLIEANCLWSASIPSLNDPCEAYSINSINKEARWIGNLFGASPHSIEAFEDLVSETHRNLIDRTGILSLSSSPLDELLWAHYADSHRGICIEYDTEKLLDNFSYDGNRVHKVHYSEHAPTLHLPHIFRSGSDIEFIVGALCHKSKRWQYEQEYSVLFERHGRVSHHPEAITALYFGSRMAQDKKDAIRTSLGTRGIKFFDIINKPNTYEFTAIPLDIERPQPPVPASDQEDLSFTILALNKRVNFKRVEIEVLLDRTMSENQLKQIHQRLARTVFSTAERHCVNFQTRASLDAGVPWAVVQNEQATVEVAFNLI